MADIRNFKKTRSIKSEGEGIVDGQEINAVAASSLHVQHSNLLEGTPVPEIKTIHDEHKTLKDIQEQIENINTDEQALSDDNPSGDEKDIIDLYYEYIKAQGLDDADIKATQLQLLENRSVNFEVNILKKIKVVFTTKPTWSNDIIVEKASKINNISVAAYNNIVSKVNTVCSLVHVDGYNIPELTRDTFEERERIIDSIPAFIFEKIVTELITFERLIAVATSDKYLETFI